MYIYYSNEETADIVEVYWDDFTVKHKHGPVVQGDEYYPFGLTFNSFKREDAVANRWKFQGQEYVDALDLGWDSFKWRNHQPDIGRFFNVDPISEDYYYNSPFAFSENKVTSHVELEGLESKSIHLNREISTAESAIRSIPERIGESIENGAESVSEAISSMPSRFKKGLNQFGSFLKEQLGDLMGDRVGSTWTQEHLGEDQKNNPEGKADGGGDISPLIGPTIRSGPASNTKEGFSQGVEIMTTIESNTGILKNVVTESGSNVNLEVDSVKNVVERKNIKFVDVTLPSGRDTAVQVSKTQDEKEK